MGRFMSSLCELLFRIRFDLESKPEGRQGCCFTLLPTNSAFLKSDVLYCGWRIEANTKMVCFSSSLVQDVDQAELISACAHLRLRSLANGPTGQEQHLRKLVRSHSSVSGAVFCLEAERRRSRQKSSDTKRKAFEDVCRPHLRGQVRLTTRLI